MTAPTIGLLSPGEMGHTIGGVLHANGARVLTHLGGRSDRSRGLADAAGIEDTPSLAALVTEADILLSVLVPARALEVAGTVAGVIAETGADLLYVDCNAIAPATVRQAESLVLAAGGRFADAGIIGPPPRTPGTTRIYASGPDAAALAVLVEDGLDIRVIGSESGQASGLKMCYAALTKGLTALGTELLIAAQQMGLADALRAEQEQSIPDVLAWLDRSIPSMPPKAYRWVGEMEEIAATFADLGLTPNILLGAADIYRMVEDTPIGRESPETRDKSRGLDGTIAALAESLPDPAVPSR
jgi:3-hydroxyisobutyrate dehydrogenase-like beta-hydroxyacid dehydrogenase